MSKYNAKNYEKTKSTVKSEALVKATVGGQVSNKSVMYNVNVPITYRVVYFAIESFCYNNKVECYPSNSLIASMVGRSVRTIQRAVKFLRENGFLHVEYRRGLSNVYTVLKKVILEKKDKDKFYEKISSDKKSDKKSYNQQEFVKYEGAYDINDPHLEKKLLGWE